MNRRESLAVLLGAASGSLAHGQIKEPVIETHIHLFSKDLTKFPGAPGWKVIPSPLEEYLEFAKQAGITNAVHVSAEPYQDDLRYVEHTITAAPPGFLKGTLLLDPIRDDTPRRMEEYAKRRPGQFVALRIHSNRLMSTPPSTSGPLRDRDLMHPGVRKCWAAAGKLGMAIQAHIQPWFAPQIETLAREMPQTRVIIDHFGHAGVIGATRTPDGGWTLGNGERGYKDPKEFDNVLRLAKLSNVVLKVSGLQYSSREPHPYRDLKPLARRAFDAFGPDRMMWGSLGAKIDVFKQHAEVFDVNFDFLSADDRRKIKSRTAARFFGFQQS